MAQKTLPKIRGNQRKSFSTSSIVRISYVVLTLAGAAFAVFYILST